VGERERAPEGVAAAGAGTGADAGAGAVGGIEYRLGPRAAARRAVATAVVRAVTALAPVALVVVLLERGGGSASLPFRAVVVAIVALVVARAVVAQAAARWRLAAMVVTVGDDALRVEAMRDACSVERARVARIVEVDGALGGLRVESEPDRRTGVVDVVHVPRGGEGYAQVRARLERWRPVVRRGRRGPAMRLAVGALVVAGIFFMPFFVEDFLARSKLAAAALVLALWVVMRLAVRGR
jgi:hypothetical protein